MSCDHRNDLTNFAGAMGLGLTRPLMSFYTDPRVIYRRHDQQPAGDKPPMPVVPLGPQAGPGFRPVFTGAALYSPPDYAPGPADLTLGAVRSGF